MGNILFHLPLAYITRNNYDGLVFFRTLHLRFIRVWLSESHVIAHEAQEKIAGILWLK